ncbi:MAG: Ig-like domain-containing protein [Spirochaetales bacterium]|nr:Ig-like domain-containing protein [Spirochaetales bacterium]
MKRIIVVLLITFFAFTGCEYVGYFWNEYTPPEAASLTVAIPLVQDYDLDRIEVTSISKTTGEVISQPMAANGINTRAEVAINLPNGDYNFYVTQEKSWDDANGCALYCQTPLKSVTVDGREREILFDNPWMTGTQNITINADVTAMMDAASESGISELEPEFAGIWMKRIRDDEFSEDEHYHFHGASMSIVGSRTYLSGNFNVQPGIYDIEVIPENFRHPEWSDDEPWHPLLTAGNIERKYVINADTAIVPVKTTYFVADDFSDIDPDTGSDLFYENRNGGILEYTVGEVFMAGNGAADVPNLVLIDELSLEDNILITFDFKLGEYTPDLNGEHPYLHVNMLTADGGDTRAFLAIEDSGINFHSSVDGTVTLSETYTAATGYFKDDAFHTLSIFIKDKKLYLYEGGNSRPLYVYTYAEGIPESGGFYFECHQEAWINAIRIERDIVGGRNLSDPNDSSGTMVFVTGVLLEDDFSLGMGQSREVKAVVLPLDAEDKGLSWSSSNENLATVDGAGNVTANGSNTGSVTITAVADDGGFSDSIDINVTYYEAVEGLWVSPSTATCQVNGTATFSLGFMPSMPTNMDYTVDIDDDYKAKVVYQNEYGFEVRGLEYGFTDITVTSDDNPSHSETIYLEVLKDTSLPRVSELLAMENKLLYLEYSEIMSDAGLLDTANYQVEKGFPGAQVTLNVSSIEKISNEDSKASLLYIHLEEELSDGDQLKLTLSNVKDSAENELDPALNDGLAGNEAICVFVASHGETIDPVFIEESTGSLLVNAGGASYPADSHWMGATSMKPGQYFLVESGAPFSQSAVVARAYINSDGSSVDSSAKPSALMDFGDSTVILPNGDYDLYVMFVYDVDGDWYTESDQYMVFGEAVPYTVSTGL